MRVGRYFRMLTPWHARGQRRPGAYQEVNVRIKGLTRMFNGLHANNAPRKTHLLPKTQTTSPITTHCQQFSPRWSALWAPHPSNHDPTATKRGGIALHEGPTRQRHASDRLHVVQTPTTNHQHFAPISNEGHRSYELRHSLNWATRNSNASQLITEQPERRSNTHISARLNVQ